MTIDLQIYLCQHSVEWLHDIGTVCSSFGDEGGPELAFDPVSGQIGCPGPAETRAACDWPLLSMSNQAGQRS